MIFNVKIGETIYPLVRDVRHAHPPEVHAHLGTVGESGLQRLIDALEQDEWFDEQGQYVGRDPFGIGLAEHA